jgi:hypothetical protein
MGSILSIVGALLPFAITELQQFKVLSPQLGNLITGIEGAAQAFISEFEGSSKTTPSVTALALLSSISAAISVLQAQTNISPADLKITSALSAAIAAGIAASSITSVDTTKLLPIQPVA